MQVRFAVRNYAGIPTRYFLADRETLTQPKPAPEMTHHVVIIDRSGSMYGNIEQLKDTVIKVLNVEEYKETGLHVSLISYSSKGDVTLHFERVPVADVVATGSKYVEAIRRIRATCLTCGSQALEMALGIVRTGETTGISLHSDGYMNDASPAAEQRAFDGLTKRVNDKLPNVFVNTIAYGWADFTLLSRIANAASGKCVQAGDIRQVYDALHDTTKLLAGRVAPAFVSGREKGVTWQVFVSPSARRINGTAGIALRIAGLRPDDDAFIWRYREVDATAYAASNRPVAGEDDPDTCIYALARAALAEGQLTLAKYALVSTRNGHLLQKHAKALTNEQLAAFAADLDDATFNGAPDAYRTADYGLPAQGMSVLATCKLLAEYSSDITFDGVQLRVGYKRRGLKKVAGSWVKDENDKLTLVPPAARSERVGDPTSLKCHGFEINHANATINVLLSEPVRLIDPATGNVIEEREGYKLDKLRAYNNYTIVGDGNLNLDTLPIRVHSKRTWRAFQTAGLVKADAEYVPAGLVLIDMEEAPLVDYDTDYAVPDTAFRKLAEFKALAGILAACLKGESSTLTGKQIEALKAIHVTPAGYFSPPSANPYTDRDMAAANGEIDSRTSYVVGIGSPEITGVDKLRSANEYLARRFAVTDPLADKDDCKRDGTLDKPKFAGHLEALFRDKDKQRTFAVKKLTAATKLDAVDDIQYPIMANFLGIERNGEVTRILRAAGATEAYVAARPDTLDEMVAHTTDGLKLLERAMERVWRDEVCPVVFYIGATGLLPDSWNATMYDADKLAEKYPTIKLKPDEKDGTFFVVLSERVVDGKRIPVETLVSVYAESAWFSTEKGVAAVKAMEAA